MQFGQRVRELREQRKLGAGEVAKGLGVSAEDYASIERNERSLSHQEITALAAVLGVEVDQLFKSEEAAPPEGGESLLIPANKLAELLDEMND